MLKNYVYLFFMSMLPMAELRVAVPFSQARDLPVVESLLICMIGNMIPVPFIYLFARKILIWGCERPFIWKPCRFFLSKGEKAGHKLTQKSDRGVFIALLLFVGIPIPGTGAWTGTLAASILDIDFKKTVLSVTLGVALAGVIMMIASVVGVNIFN